GYHWIGCRVLKTLVELGHQVQVFTHEAPYHVNDLKAYAENIGVSVTTDRLRVNRIEIDADVICSIYYRNIIDDPCIDSVGGRAINLHPSMLPDYRGCSSLTWAMIRGETEAGYSYHYLTSEVDKGNILLQKRVAIEPFDTQATLYQRVMFMAAEDFAQVLQLVSENHPGAKQPSGVGEYYPRGCPFEGEIDPAWTRDEIERFTRAMIYPPLPPAKWQGKEVRSLKEFDEISGQS
ncbi:MAG: formyltransferase family protein, partial [Planctomycetota bacterium]